MGCCSSRHRDNRESNEQDPLLGGSNPSYSQPTGQQATTSSALTKAQEEAILKDIVRRTAEALIDVSNNQLSEGLDEEEIRRRSARYAEIVKKVQIPDDMFTSKRGKSKSISSRNAPSGSFKPHSFGSYSAFAKSVTPPEIIFDKYVMNQDDVRFMKDACEDLNKAYKQSYKVKDCGPIVKEFSIE